MRISIKSNPEVLWLSTLRSHDQYNSTIYSNNDRYRGVYNQRDVLFLNDKEIKRRGLCARRSRRHTHSVVRRSRARRARFQGSPIQHP